MAELDIRSPSHPARTKVRLRVRPGDAEDVARRLSLPPALRSGERAGWLALWLAPDQWLLLSDRATAAQLIEQCRDTLAGVLHLALDVSAALECVTLEGPRVRELLAMGSGVDWSPSAVPIGACLRTRFARIVVLVHATAGGAFDLYVDRSLRDYLERWFRHAAGDPLLHGSKNPQEPL